MSDESRTSGPRNITVVNYDYGTFEKNNYIARPPTFSGDPTEFEWWKRKMYTYIIGLDNEM